MGSECVCYRGGGLLNSTNALESSSSELGAEAYGDPGTLSILRIYVSVVPPCPLLRWWQLVVNQLNELAEGRYKIA